VLASVERECPMYAITCALALTGDR
jgi:hypothetical protein